MAELWLQFVKTWSFYPIFNGIETGMQHLIVVGRKFATP